MSLIALTLGLSLMASQERLADARCDRMGEIIADYDTSRRFASMGAATYGYEDPLKDEFQPRMDRAMVWVRARNLEARSATQEDGILYRSVLGDILTEFERRCLSRAS